MMAVPRNRLVAFLLIALGGAALDLATKSWAFHTLGMPSGSIDEHTLWLWKNVFGFTTSLNEGALFGIGQGRAFLFAGLSMLAAAGILYWLFVVGAARDWLLNVSLALVTAGIIGNLYDRLGMPGLSWSVHPLHERGEPVYAVRDWLNFQLINWPIFNLADSCLVCGACLLVWQAFRHAAPATQIAPSSASREI
jgi:signal peptidase II